MGFKQRLEGTPVIGTGLAVQERYKLDGADPFAAAIGFFAFLSLFPLLALAVSLAGFVLADPDDQVAVAEAITEAIPGFEATMEDGDVAALVENVVEERGTIGGVGIVLLLLSGLRVVNGAMIATRVVFRGEVQKGLIAKVRQVGALVGLGLLALAGVAGSSLAGIGIGQLPAAANVVMSLAISFAFDLLLFVAAYTLLSPTSTLKVRQLIPGAVLAAIGWTGLKVAGASYVGNQIEGANALYGALGGVIALMLLFYLAGRLYLYGAELNAVKVEREHGPLVAPTATTATTASSAASASDGPGGEGPAATEGSSATEAPGGRGQADEAPGREGLTEEGPAEAGPGGHGRAEEGPGREGPAAHSGAGSSGRRVAAGRQGASNGQGAPDADGPPPVPRLALAPRPLDPGPTGQSPTIGAETRRQLIGAEQRRVDDAAARDAGADARHAVAIGLGLAALAAGYRFLRSDSD